MLLYEHDCMLLYEHDCMLLYEHGCMLLYEHDCRTPVLVFGVNVALLLLMVDSGYSADNDIP